MLAQWLSFAAYAAFGVFTVLLARIDLREHRLPNRLIAWATLTVIPLLSAASIVAQDWWGLLFAWIAAAVFGVLTLLFWLRWRLQLGAGDVKLMPVAAFAAVWGSAGHEYLAALIVFPAIMLGGLAVVGLVSLLRRREHFAAGPVVLSASWLTTIMPPEPLGALLAR